jgi:hypothetical protein
MVEKISIKCTSNGRSVEANLVSRTNDLLRVFVPGTDVQMSMPKIKDQYVGNRAGLEFTSSGKAIR